jgi:hypothetical protein
MEHRYKAESMKFLLKPKHWKAAREIVSMMKEAEAKVVSQFWQEVGVRLKKKGWLIKPEYFEANNIRGIWSPIPNWPEHVYYDMGQTVEAGRRYLYCEISIEKLDKRARNLMKKLQASRLEDVRFSLDSKGRGVYREFTPTSEPEDWPMYGKEAAALADEVTQKCESFLSAVDPLVSRTKRRAS